MSTLTAKVITPVAVSDAMLISCTVPEPAATETAWVSGTTYAIGDVRIRTTTHKKYKRLTAGAGTTAPESDPTNWLDVGATLRWAQFDKKIGTQTTLTGNLVTVLSPGIVQGIAVLEALGKSVRVVMTDAPGGATVYDRTVSLDGSIITSVYEWMYGERKQLNLMVLTDLPGQYPSCQITVTIDGGTGVSGAGVLLLGRVQTIGCTEYGAGAGIINFGKIVDDGFGTREWLEGGFANRVTLPLMAYREDFSRLHRQLGALRSTPALYVGSELDNLTPLVCYGVFKDLYITVPNFPLISLNLEIEGLNSI